MISGISTYRRRSTLRRQLLIVAAAAALLMVPSLSTSNAATLVKTSSASILVNGAGMTLYVFAPDPPNKSTCYGKCAKYWPPALVAAGATVSSTMSGIPGTFGTTMRTDGTHQLTYDGAPLYTFVLDKKPGMMAGQGSTASGGYWWVVVAGGK